MADTSELSTDIDRLIAIVNTLYESKTAPAEEKEKLEQAAVVLDVKIKASCERFGISYSPPPEIHIDADPYRDVVWPSGKKERRYYHHLAGCHYYGFTRMPYRGVWGSGYAALPPARLDAWEAAMKSLRAIVQAAMPMEETEPKESPRNPFAELHAWVAVRTESASKVVDLLKGQAATFSNFHALSISQINTIRRKYRERANELGITVVELIEREKK